MLIFPLPLTRRKGKKSIYSAAPHIPKGGKKNHVTTKRVSMVEGWWLVVAERTYNSVSSLQGLLESKPFPWYAGAMCALLVLSSVLFMPGVAILRRLGILKYDRAKVAAADTKGHTSSTVHFLNSQLSTQFDEADNGLIEEYKDALDSVRGEPEKPIKVTLEDILPSRSKDSRV